MPKLSISDSELPISLRWLLEKLKAAGFDKQRIHYQCSREQLDAHGIDPAMIKVWALKSMPVTLDGHKQVLFSAVEEQNGGLSFFIHRDLVD